MKNKSYFVRARALTPTYYFYCRGIQLPLTTFIAGESRSHLKLCLHKDDEDDKEFVHVLSRDDDRLLELF